jgi:hypothetical protein
MIPKAWPCTGACAAGPPHDQAFVVAPWNGALDQRYTLGVVEEEEEEEVMLLVPDR